MYTRSQTSPTPANSRRCSRPRRLRPRSARRRRRRSARSTARPSSAPEASPPPPRFVRSARSVHHAVITRLMNGASVVEMTKQLNLSREIQLDAQEMVRRAERGVGLAVRNGQVDGTVQTRVDGGWRSASRNLEVPLENLKTPVREIATSGAAAEDLFPKGTPPPTTDIRVLSTPGCRPRTASPGPKIVSGSRSQAGIYSLTGSPVGGRCGGL